MRNVALSSLLLILTSCSTAVVRSNGRPIGFVTFTSTRSSEVLDAFRQVLQNDSFTLKVTDTKAGKIIATMDKLEKGSPFPKYFFAPGLSYEIWVSVLSEKDGKVQLRLSIQRIEHLQLGGERGEEFVEDAWYRGTITKVMRELNKKGWKGSAS